MNDFENNFQKAYQMLNPEQRQAVDQIEGPLLVIAGPGTGKTQLLSTRIAKILRDTDASADNILAMTFTDAGARNMRERLTTFIGADSYKVGIYTYHAFAGEIITGYPEFFIDRNLDNLVDDVSLHQILSQIHEQIDPKSPFKNSSLSEIAKAISELKQALITPLELKKIAEQNTRLDLGLLKNLREIDFESIKNKRKEDIIKPFYEKVLLAIGQTLSGEAPVSEKIKPNLFYAFEDLRAVLEDEPEKFSTKPYSNWKKAYLGRVGADGKPQPTDFVKNKKLVELADFYQKYEDTLRQNSAFDYNDMILETIRAMENFDELRLTLQEKYQYILLDEYQDTNGAQSRLIELLTDNELFEGRPNVMAVGDDDQAIMAFQGARSSNMLDFFNRYRDTGLVNLRVNYRSHSKILESAGAIAEQISDRLTQNLPIEIKKNIVAFNDGNFDAPQILRKDFLSQAAEFDWTAEEISKLIQSGVEPNEIAVLSPKHAVLQDFAPHLKSRDVAVNYEKRENIFEDKTIRALVKISQLTAAIKDKNWDKINEIFPEVLSFDFWKLSALEIWKLSWRAEHNPRFWLGEIFETPKSTSTDPTEVPDTAELESVRSVARFLVQVAIKMNDFSLEQMLDIILGTAKFDDSDFVSPIRAHLSQISEEEYYDTLLNLTVLREHLREFLKEKSSSLRDLAEFAAIYEMAELRIVNTNPHKVSDDAVNLMTAYKSKGLEFSHVFMLGVNNSGWNSDRKGKDGISLPKNLEFVRIKDGGENTRKRLFFVALTRAKTHLYLTNPLKNFSGNNNSRLEFLNEVEEKVGEEKFFIAKNLPTEFQKVEMTENDKLSLQAIENNWHGFYQVRNEKMRDLLRARLDNYRISASHINSFTQVKYGGPQSFFENTILRFPSGENVNSATGSIVHALVSRAQNELRASGNFDSDKIIARASQEAKKYNFGEKDTAEIVKTAQDSLRFIFENRREIFAQDNLAEENFRAAGVVVGEAILTGNIDYLQIDKTTKKITVIDWKTGHIPLDRNDETKIQTSAPKTYNYENQLYAYKILVENSPKFAGYTVTDGVVEFIEPIDGRGFSHRIKFDGLREDFIKLLIRAVYDKVKNFEFEDDISGFNDDLKGIRQYQNQLVREFAEKIGLSEAPLWVFERTKTYLAMSEI